MRSIGARWRSRQRLLVHRGRVASEPTPASPGRSRPRRRPHCPRRLDRRRPPSTRLRSTRWRPRRRSHRPPSSAHRPRGRRRRARGVRPRGARRSPWPTARCATLCLWLAASGEQRSRGLMFVTDLGGADGMAFRYESPHSGRLLDEEHRAAVVDRVLWRRRCVPRRVRHGPLHRRPVPHVPDARRLRRRDRDVPGRPRRPRHRTRQHPPAHRPPLRREQRVRRFSVVVVADSQAS